jgi:hypothetical protein
MDMRDKMIASISSVQDNSKFVKGENNEKITRSKPHGLSHTSMVRGEL